MENPVTPSSVPIDESRRLDELLRDLRGVMACPILYGRVVDKPTVASETGTTLDLTASTALRVEHGLGRAPKGYMIIFLESAATSVTVRNNSDPDEYHLELIADQNCTLKLWVF